MSFREHFYIFVEYSGRVRTGYLSATMSLLQNNNAGPSLKSQLIGKDSSSNQSVPRKTNRISGKIGQQIFHGKINDVSTWLLEKKYSGCTLVVRSDVVRS